MRGGKLVLAILVRHQGDFVSCLHHTQLDVLLNEISLPRLHLQRQQAVVLREGAEVVLARLQRKEEVVIATVDALQSPSTASLDCTLFPSMEGRST